MKSNIIYNEDCISGMKKIPDSSVDLIVTSPPYNLDIKYDIYNDNLPWNDYLAWIESWMEECFRILKDDGRICINHYIGFRGTDKKDRFPIMDIRQIQEKIGFNVSKLIIWEEKTKSILTAWGSWLSASSPYIQTPAEGILISYKKTWKKQTKGKSTIQKENFIKGVSGFWNFAPDKSSSTIATFPVELPLMCIELLSYENDIIVDPFMGSGTTAIACIQSNRRYIGFELSFQTILLNFDFFFLNHYNTSSNDLIKNVSVNWYSSFQYREIIFFNNIRKQIDELMILEFYYNRKVI